MGHSFRHGKINLCAKKEKRDSLSAILKRVSKCPIADVLSFEILKRKNYILRMRTISLTITRKLRLILSIQLLTRGQFTWRAPTIRLYSKATFRWFFVKLWATNTGAVPNKLKLSCSILRSAAQGRVKKTEHKTNARKTANLWFTAVTGIWWLGG